MDFTDEAYQNILNQEGITEHELIQLMKEQTVLMGRIPFERLQYGANCEAPVDEGKYPVLQKIHPRQRAKVEKILSSNIPDSVHKIVVFGSSIGLHCKETSDLDVCIVGERVARDEKDDPWIFPLHLGCIDLIYTTDEEYNRTAVPGFLGDDIKGKGIVIWETNEQL